MLLAEYELPEVLLVDQQSMLTACNELKLLKQRADDLQTNIDQMINDISTAYRGKVEEELKKLIGDNWSEPVAELRLVVGEMYSTLESIAGPDLYGKVASGFISLNESIVEGDANKEGIKVKSN